MSFNKFLLFFALTAVTVDPSIAADSLAVSPLNPTTSDSIRLSIIIKNQNCCIQNLYDSTAVILLNDSTIALSFRNYSNVVIFNDSTDTFDTFSFSSPIICPCPLRDPPVLTVLSYKRGPLPAGNYSVYEDNAFLTSIGNFTVSRPTSAIFQSKALPRKNIGKMSGNVRVYDIRGAIVSSNLIGLANRTSGVYFVKTNDGISTKLKIGF